MEPKLEDKKPIQGNQEENLTQIKQEEIPVSSIEEVKPETQNIENLEVKVKEEAQKDEESTKLKEE